MKFVPNPILFSSLPILKLWAKGFDISIPESLRYQIENVHLSYNRYTALPEAVVTAPLQGKIVDDYLAALTNVVWDSLIGTQNTLIDATFEGLSAKESSQIVWQDIYAAELGFALYSIHAQTSGLPPLLALMASDEDNYALKITVIELEKMPAWIEFTSQLAKEDKDKIRRWTDTEELPTKTKILSMLRSSSLDLTEQKYITTLLLHARFIDSLKRGVLTSSIFKAIRMRLLGLDFESYVLHERNQICQRNSEYFDVLMEHNERINREKASGNMAQYQRSLKVLQRQYATEPRGWGFKIHFDWLSARCALQQGEVKRACRLYNKVVEYAVCIPPENMERLLNEALMCASVAGKNGDAVLLKKAKNLCIIFGFLQPHDHPDDWPSTPHESVNDFVKPYEIEELQRKLKKFMPTAKIDFSNVPSPFIVAYVEDTKMSSPNRKSKIGDSNMRLEQISQAVQQRNYLEFESMLNETKLTDIGEHSRGHSALIIALQNFVNTYSSDDKHVVYLILEKLKKGAKEKGIIVAKQLNTRTDKKKMTALSLAIDSCDPKIVTSLLDLGADANLRSSREFTTPLMQAMRLVSACLGSPALREEHLENARQNVFALLQAGAKAELTHDMPGPGYTAVMLAAELDEVVLLDAFNKSSTAVSLTDVSA